MIAVTIFQIEHNASVDFLARTDMRLIQYMHATALWSSGTYAKALMIMRQCNH